MTSRPPRSSSPARQGAGSRADFPALQHGRVPFRIPAPCAVQKAKSSPLATAYRAVARGRCFPVMKLSDSQRRTNRLLHLTYSSPTLICTLGYKIFVRDSRRYFRGIGKVCVGTSKKYYLGFTLGMLLCSNTATYPTNS